MTPRRFLTADRASLAACRATRLAGLTGPGGSSGSSTTGMPAGMSGRKSPGSEGSATTSRSSYRISGWEPEKEMQRSRTPSSASTTTSPGKNNPPRGESNADAEAVTAAAAGHDLPAAGQLVFQQPGRVKQVRDLSRQRHRGPGGYLVLADPPAPLPVADDRLGPVPSRAPGVEQRLDPVLAGSAEAKPEDRVYGRDPFAGRVDERAEPAEARAPCAVRDLGQHRGDVVPLVQRGRDARRPAVRAGVQQAQHLVAGRRGVRGQRPVGRGHLRVGLLPRGRFEGPERCVLDQRAKAARGQARCELGHLPGPGPFGVLGGPLSSTESHPPGGRNGAL